ncbi:MAG: UbiA family prenyltransferase [Balneolaceae bacterium]
MMKEIKHFILHLRLHYQFMLLSGGFLLGGFMSPEMNAQQYWLQFLNVHVLLFGGATAYNSWWDKDTGPIGGLKHPPKMELWMHRISLIMMFTGFIWACYIGWLYAMVYMISLILFWLYSTPHARWKGRPIISLFAIGISTGFNSVLLGTISAGGSINQPILLVALGASLILLSMYPVSQIFQQDEDLKRKDVTFTIVYGVKGMRNFFLINFALGLILLSVGVYNVSQFSAWVLFVGCCISGTFLAKIIFTLKGNINEYGKVMMAKTIASLSFALFFLIANVLKHGWLGQTFFNEYFK